MTANLRTIVVTLILISFVFLLAAPALIGRAQSGETPPAWGEFVNPDGSVNWSDLTYAGEVTQPAEWMNIEVPGGIQVPLGEATYNRYLTPSGNVLVLPSPATLFMTFLHPQESGFSQNPPEMLGSGAALMAMLAADYINPSDLQALGYVDTADFFQAVIDGQENIWIAPISPAQVRIPTLSCQLKDKGRNHPGCDMESHLTLRRHSSFS